MLIKAQTSQFCHKLSFGRILARAQTSQILPQAQLWSRIMALAQTSQILPQAQLWSRILALAQTSQILPQAQLRPHFGLISDLSLPETTTHTKTINFPFCSPHFSTSFWNPNLLIHNPPFNP